VNAGSAPPSPRGEGRGEGDLERKNAYSMQRRINPLQSSDKKRAPCATIRRRPRRNSGQLCEPASSAASNSDGSHQMAPYIVDFYCHQLGLIVELDGDSHAETRQYDARRTQRLMRGGSHVLALPEHRCAIAF